MKKRFLPLLLVGVLISGMCSMSATASSLDSVQTSPEVYTATIDVALTPAYAASTDSTQTASASMGLALDPLASGWSNIVNVRFTTLPSNAVVQSIKVVPGKALVNNGNTNMLGAVLPATLQVTAPSGQVGTISWGNTMTDSSSFLNRDAKGTWTMKFYGTNIARPTGDPMQDLLRAGSVSFKSVQMTVTYTLK